ncbi:MAG: ABC transporter ATP-binding protein [Candidatus Nomurabacteria bacterium]|nr:ABC transporter ATP-binding protein [Candidatus Nomurabacteria bacterium]
MSFRRIFSYYWDVIKQYKIAFFSVFFLSAGRMFFSTTVAGLIYKEIIDTLNNNLLSVDVRYHILVVFLISMSVCFILGTFMNRWADYIYFRFLSKSIKNIYDTSFKKITMHSYNFFTNNFAGSLVTKIKRFSQSFDTSADLIFNNFWQIIAAVILSIAALSFQSKVLSLYFLIWCLIYAILVGLFVKSKVQIDLKWAEADSKITGFLSDSISNILNIKIFSAFKNEFKSFDELSTNLREKSFKSYKFYVIRSAAQAFLMIVFHIFILFTLIALWRDGKISVGVFVMTYTYLLAIFDRMWDLSHGLTRFMKAMTDAKEAIDIFDKVPDIQDIKNPEILKITDGKINFENISFEYIEGNEVFTDFNLEIKAGEKIGIVGYSGSGKSTITKLLLRFSDVKDGAIKIDNQDISKITQDDLRSKISYVPQEPILFHRSIKENIGYSRPEASFEEIVEAAKKAHAHEFIEKLQYGYDTLVGERGVKLSGGERQRVAIARAMLKPTPILILDEATSSLDSISESYIQEAFNELMKGKTTIIIAHRLSTIQKMDRIIVLDKGKIIEEGTHKVLLKNKGLYSELWDHQSGGFIE